MTRLGYVQFTLFLLCFVAFMSAPDAVSMPRGSVIAVRAQPDGTALVAWHGDAADFVTHQRADGRLISAELARERLDPFAFMDPEPAAPHDDVRGRGTYRGQPIILRADSISIGGIDHALPHVLIGGLVPERLSPVAGELPQYVGIATEDGPIVIDLETAGIVWRGNERFAIVVRDGTHVYVVDHTRVRTFDPMTFSMSVVAEGDVRLEQIGGGYIWTYDRDDHPLDSGAVHARAPATNRPLTASR